MRLILASASPRRADLLRAAGFTFDIVVPDVDESRRNGETARDYVRRLAREKAGAVCAAVPAAAQGLSAATSVVIAADTVVVVDDDILGKPRDDREAAEMLRRLSGRWHEVTTGVCLCSNAREIVDVATTRVQVASLSEDDVRWYVTSGETRDKAGAYAIQGLASRFIPCIEGSYTNVVGLPVELVARLLTRFETRYPVG